MDEGEKQGGPIRPIRPIRWRIIFPHRVFSLNLILPHASFWSFDSFLVQAISTDETDMLKATKVKNFVAMTFSLIKIFPGF